MLPGWRGSNEHATATAPNAGLPALVGPRWGAHSSVMFAEQQHKTYHRLNPRTRDSVPLQELSSVGVPCACQLRSTRTLPLPSDAKQFMTAGTSRALQGGP